MSAVILPRRRLLLSGRPGLDFVYSYAGFTLAGAMPEAATCQDFDTLLTVAKVHNWHGRLYIAPVRPAHRFVARAVVRAVNNGA